ncbi:hypothetical protein F2Q69_00009685 [Brassica cretica]|uniref:Uncharacterized protein n=1 Tax=Brassica cretica TaxID=69181 RepID=A0A8S9NYA3_BRACR|nr:hypothetical protein F2Q69_00009685 [Brassica cretica]
MGLHPSRVAPSNVSGSRGLVGPKAWIRWSIGFLELALGIFSEVALREVAGSTLYRRGGTVVIKKSCARRWPIGFLGHALEIYGEVVLREKEKAHLSSGCSGGSPPPEASCFLFPFLSLASSLVHPSLLICFRPCCDEAEQKRRNLYLDGPLGFSGSLWGFLVRWSFGLSRNGGISTSVSDLHVSLGGVVVSRRGWFLGVLAVKSAFGLRSGIQWLGVLLRVGEEFFGVGGFVFSGRVGETFLPSPLLLGFGDSPETSSWLCWMLCSSYCCCVVRVPLPFSKLRRAVYDLFLVSSRLLQLVTLGLRRFWCLFCISCLFLEGLPFRFVGVAHRLSHVGVALALLLELGPVLGLSVRRRFLTSCGSWEGQFVEEASCLDMSSQHQC